jgi:hypothetical protein
MDRIKQWSGVMALGAILVGLLLGAAQNNYPGTRGYELSGPATGVFTPTQSDSAGLPFVTRGIHFHADGTIAFRSVDGTNGDEVVTAGQVLPIQVDWIYDTGTSLSNSDMRCYK